MENSENKIKEINPNLEPLWTVVQVAKYLSISPVTVYQWVRLKKIGHVKFSNRVRIPKSEVERIVGDITSKINN